MRVPPDRVLLARSAQRVIAMTTQTSVVFIAGAALPALIIALLATPVVRSSAARFGLIDLPGERKMHTSPTPRGGGIAIWLGVIVTFAAGQLILWYAMQSTANASIVPAFARPHLAGALAQSGKL